MARPSDYTEELGQLICEKIAEGKSLRKICEAEGMPDRGTVLRWVAKDQEFRNQYAKAMEVRAELIFDEILDIADNGEQDFVDAGDGAVKLNMEHIKRSQLRVDARKWVVCKMLPKKYGTQKIPDTPAAGGMSDPDADI